MCLNNSERKTAMTMGLEQIADRASALNIEAIANCIVEQVRSMKIFLFGSFADGSYNSDSDYDFYIVVRDEEDPCDIRKKVRKAIRDVQNRPVDIVVGSESRLKKYGTFVDTLFIEGEVFNKGILLYDENKH